MYDDALSVATSQIAILKPSNKNRGVSGISSKISQSKKSQISNTSPTNSNTHRQLTDRDMANDVKILRNLQTERDKLRKRLSQVKEPDFLLNLKKELRTTQDEIKQ